MPKPGLIRPPELNPISSQPYQRYLSGAFDDSLTILEKLNKVIYYLNQIGELTSEMLEKWNDVYEWVMGNGLENAIENKLDEWLEDGTLDKIINEKLFGELSRLVQSVYDIEHKFDYRNLPARYLTDVGGKRNAVNQSINIDPTTNRIYVTQADAKSPEGFVLTECTPSGAYISHMHIPGGGHGTTIGLDRKEGNTLKFWTNHPQTGKLILFDYKPNTVLDVTTVTNMTDYTPASLRGKYFTVSLDPYYDQILFRMEDGTCQTRNRNDVKTFQDKLIYEMTIDFSNNVDREWMQGVVVYGKNLYWLSGSSNPGEPIRITHYDMQTKSKLFTRSIIDLPTEDGVFSFRDDFKEPEGITYFIDPNGKQHLLFIVTTGGGNKRYHMLYDISQRDGNEHFDHIMRQGGANYRMMRSDGRALTKKDSDQNLIDILSPGVYFLREDEIKTMSDFPYIKEFDWYLFVLPAQTHLNTKQILMRAEYQSRDILLSRMVEMTGEDGTSPRPGRWTSILTGGDMEYLLAEAIGNQLSNFSFAGEYYITSAQAELITDSPVTGFGLRLLNSSENLEGKITQTVELNSETYRIYKRILTVNTKEVTEWKRYDFTPTV